MFKRSLPVLMYHHVAPIDMDHNIKPEVFEDHLRSFRRNAWKTLSAEEFLHCLQADSIPKKAVVLTFDDGFADNYLFAYPLLKKYGMKAVLFASSGFMDDTQVQRKAFLPCTHEEAWRLAYTDRRSEVMCTWNELAEMENSGAFDIQSHGYSHKTPVYLARKDYGELKEDLKRGKEELELRLSKRVDHLAWPKGRYDETGVNIALDLGYKAIYSVMRGSNTSEDLRALKRISVKYKNGRSLINKLRIYSCVLSTRLYLGIRRKA